MNIDLLLDDVYNEIYNEEISQYRRDIVSEYIKFINREIYRQFFKIKNVPNMKDSTEIMNDAQLGMCIEQTLYRLDVDGESLYAPDISHFNHMELAYVIQKMENKIFKKLEDPKYISKVDGVKTRPGEILDIEKPGKRYL